MQRGLELVRDVRRELAPYALRPAPLRHVEDEQNRASAVTGLTVSWYSRPMRSMPASARSPPRAAPAARAAPGCGPRSGCPGPTQSSPAPKIRRAAGLMLSTRALRVQKDEPLRHAARDGFEFAPPPVKLVQLGAYLPLLPLHAGQQGRELVVCLVFKRMVQVYGVERSHDALRQPRSQKG